ncbi:hypothetical protein [Microvirga zambiensis]|uniref:hypothetical protein n=1 Tax=Microvirga zambiensis TaxID=1402137 RepID=UPI00191FA486|nr:hypothetical protein [Microvirga zambiensis]
MWTEDMPSKRGWTNDPLRPAQVLYEFDGPLIFTVRSGLAEILFYKVDELDDANLFLATQTSDQIISALKEGRLSVRGALLQSNHWVVETSPNLVVTRYWPLSIRDVPESFFPLETVPLYSHFGPAPDSIEQAEAFFSMGFHGEAMTHAGMMFGTFKNLINNAYLTARKVLSPDFLAGSRTSTFDFEMYEPRFGSLIIALKEPVVNSENIRRRAQLAEVPIDAVQQQIEAQAQSFIKDLGTVVKQADEGVIRPATAESHFYLLDNLQGVLPTDENKITSVEFSVRSDGKTRSLSINKTSGERIQTAYRNLENAIVFDVGTLDVINRPSKTFVMMSKRGKQVTCAMEPEIFNWLLSDERFKPGARIIVRGRRSRRKYRDFLQVSGRPRILRPLIGLAVEQDIFE